MRRLCNLCALAGTIISIMLGCGAPSSQEKNASNTEAVSAAPSTAATHSTDTNTATQTEAEQSDAAQPTAVPTAASDQIVQATATPAPAAQATVAAQAGGKKVYASLGDLTLKAGGNVQIGNDMPMPPEMMNSSDVKKALGDLQIAGGRMQQVTLGQLKGDIVYLEFTNESDAENGAKLLQDFVKSQPASDQGTMLVYGKYVVGVHTEQTADLDGFTKAVQELLD